jgi:hypothetical protein
MEIASGPICEYSFSVDNEVVDSFDLWLAGQIEVALQSADISSIETYQQEDDEQGRARRIVHYRFSGDAELEQYDSLQSASGIDSATDRFGEGVRITQRTLQHVEGALTPSEACLNCGTALNGQYCGHCGQRSSNRLISVWELLRDAFGDLLELDSRLWRTLLPLLLRPGQLTREYLEGRRTRYMPPFRMYLVLSIVFFLVAFFDPREELGFLFEPEAQTDSQTSTQDSTDTDEIRDEILSDLALEGIIVTESNGDDAAVEDNDEQSGDDAARPGLSFSTDDDSEPACDLDEVDTSDWPIWLSSRLTETRLQAACDRILADGGTSALGKKLLDNIPAALFVLLPLMALVLKILYPLSKRYYVEHLLFVVHYHAFVFLVLSLQVLFARLGSLARVPELALDITALAVSLYVPVYLYKALRRVYGQSALFAALKFLTLMLAYFSGLLIMFALVALIAAFSL